MFILDMSIYHPIPQLVTGDFVTLIKTLLALAPKNPPPHIVEAINELQAALDEANSKLVVRIDEDLSTKLERAFDLLEALAGGGELGVTELAARTGLVPSTAHRLLGTLTKRGYVVHSPETGRYLLGYKVVEVASGLEHRLGRVRALARPHLETIQHATGETVNLVVLDGSRVVYVDQVEGSRSVRMFTAVGTSAPRR